MFAQLGDIVFDGVLGPEALSISGEETYAEHALINVRPKLDHTGTGLRTINMTIQFHFQFCTPETQSAAMWKHKEQADILTFVLGNGRIIGDFVITAITETPSQTDGFGTYICVKLNITLKEVYAEIKTIQVQQAAKNNALALSENGPTPVRIRSKEWLTAMWAITESVAEVMSLVAATANIVKYATTPEFWLMQSNQIEIYMNGGIDAATSLIDTLTDPALTTLCPDLLDAATANLAALQALHDAMPITDFSILDDLNDDIQATAQAMYTAHLPAFYNIILRR